ncbi:MULTISPECIES: hypothetical protein [Paraburkholderia]|jgi:hypothetical protein|uniref:Cellulase family glycosylhydrolase n=1 Tax=Paraburkholderia madseniana TaxID=2599607 RepID=A0AAP5BHZ0_9BURK|nr:MULTISPECIES: hypothetical protein [Paraburkholderia]MCX4149284.1 hypothetical protein [Paraburkholderia madseniana]MDN7152219.1 hypothetical protein [Paraburkholderia sp. WS6]MDQ6411101.1 hypothetical protein [Paraburkholderia madseniana]
MKTVIGWMFVFVGLLNVTFASADGARVERRLENLRMVNYYRADAGWGFFWQRWDDKKVNEDFGRLHKLGFNTVRVFLQPAEIGFPSVSDLSAEKIKKLFAIAKRNGLKVQLTLFDLWGDFDKIDDSKEWVRQLTRIINHPDEIAYIDIKNEINVSDSKAQRWVMEVLPYTKHAFGSVPVTFSLVVGVTRPIDTLIKSALDAKIAPDLWDVHYYMSPQKLPEVISVIRSEINDTPLFFGEVGGSSIGASNVSLSDVDCSVNGNKQAQYVTDIEKALRKERLPYGGVWVYSDFYPSAIPGNLGVSRKPAEYCFGLFFSNGDEKPLAAAMHDIFSK